MSVNILLSNSISGASKACLEKLVGNYSLTKKYIVLTTDRNTLFVEKKLLSMLESGGMANVDVATFSRISARNLPESRKCLTPEGSVMLMRKATNKIKDKLAYYKNSCHSDGFVRDMYTTITALRNCSVTVNALKNTMSVLSGNLALKTQDILLIYETYLTLLGQSYYDGTSRLEAFGDYLDSSNPFDGAEVFILGFSAFNGQSLALIDKLVTRCKNLTIALPCYPLGENARLYPTKTLMQIREIFSRYDVKINEELHILSNDFTKNIEDNLYSYCKIEKIANGNIEAFSAKSIYSEAEYIAYSIRKAIRHDNLRYKQIAIACPSIRDYKEALIKYFHLHNIPYHIDDDEPIAKHCYVRLLNEIFDTVLQNFKRDSLFKLLKNPLLFFPFDKIIEYENFCIEFDVNYSRFINYADLDVFSCYDKIKETAEGIANLCCSLKGLKVKKTCAEIVTELYSFISDYRISERLDDTEQQLFDDCDNEMRDMSKHIYDKIKQLFGVIVMINGDEELSLKDFYKLYKNSIASEKMVLLPVSNDCVVVRSVENLMTDGIDTLYICGAIEGSFPLETAEQTIITLKEASVLHKNNCPFEPTRKDSAVSGRFNILQLLISNYNKLIISYPESRTDGSKCVFAHIASRLVSIFGVKIKSVDNILSFSAIAAARVAMTDILGTENNAKRIFLSRLIGVQKAVFGGLSAGELAVYDSVYHLLAMEKNNIDKKVFLPKTQSVSLTANTIQLYFDRGRTDGKKVSVSELENYFTCPRLHFYRYGLSANKRKSSEIESLDIGNIVHGVLEEFFKIKEYKNVDIRKIVKKLLENREEIKIYQYKENDKSVDLMLADLYEECVKIVETMREYEDGSQFNLLEVERFFDTSKTGDGDLYGETQGEKIYFYGKIDRVDRCRDKIAIFDYKTGKADASLSKVYYGTKLQLFFYMKCLTSDGKSIPAGAFYIPISSKYVKDGEIGKPFVGYALNDIDTLLAFDENAKDEGKFVKIKINKDGTPSKVQSGLLPLGEFNDVCNYTALMVKQAITEIGEGYIAEKPSKTCCDYCEFSSVCKFFIGEKKERDTGKAIKCSKFSEVFFDEKAKIQGGNNEVLIDSDNGHNIRTSEGGE